MNIENIVIDCAPGQPRPDIYLDQVIVETGLTTEDFENISKSFGAWTWAVSPEKSELYREKKSTIMVKLKDLYNRGCIRYAEV